MPADYGVTPINFGSLRYASAPNAHVKLKKKSRYVTPRHHMPTSGNKNSLRYATTSNAHVHLSGVAAPTSVVGILFTSTSSRSIASGSIDFAISFARIDLVLNDALACGA